VAAARVEAIEPRAAALGVQAATAMPQASRESRAILMLRRYHAVLAVKAWTKVMTQVRFDLPRAETI
jgi:hypothetical protein